MDKATFINQAINTTVRIIYAALSIFEPPDVDKLLGFFQCLLCQYTEFSFAAPKLG